MNNRWVIVILILTSLLSGSFIYFITRSDSIYVNQWLNSIDHGNVLRTFQGLILNTQLPGWIIYSLPNGLWMLALILTIMTIWNFKVNVRSIPWIILSVASGLLFEIFQGFQLIRGTFDIKDLFWIFVAAILPLSLIILKLRSCKAN